MEGLGWSRGWVDGDKKEEIGNIYNEVNNNKKQTFTKEKN